MLLACTAVSKADLGIMTLIGKEIWVRFRLPLSNFFPIDLRISLPADLDLETIFWSLHILPPFEWPSSCRTGPEAG